MKNTMTDYELVAILHPRLDDDGVVKMTELVQGRIADLGGQVAATTPWGRRTLSYPIRKQNEATYVQFDFQLEGTKLAELTRALRLQEDVLRHLAVRKSDR